MATKSVAARRRLGRASSRDARAPARLTEDCAIAATPARVTYVYHMQYAKQRGVRGLHHVTAGATGAAVANAWGLGGEALGVLASACARTYMHHVARDVIPVYAIRTHLSI